MEKITSTPVWVNCVMSTNVLVFPVFLTAALFGAGASATTWDSPENQRVLAENGKFVFQITLNSNWSKEPGSCRGSLYAKNGNSLKLLWERSLINNVRPIRAFVSDSGEYVVTAGEWYDLEQLPIVVYGTDGRLINVYGDLRQLVPLFSNQTVTGRDNGRRLPYSWNGRTLPYLSGSRDWLSHSLLFFAPEDRYFIVRLSTGEILVFQTSTGELADDQWQEESRILGDRGKEYGQLKENLQKLIIMRALKLASSDVSAQKDDGLFVLGQCKDREAISVLEQSLNDPTFRVVDTPQGKTREYPIRKAAIATLKAMSQTVPEGVVTEERVPAEAGERK